MVLIENPRNPGGPPIDVAYEDLPKYGISITSGGQGGNPGFFYSNSRTSSGFGGRGYDEQTVSSIGYPILGGSRGQTNYGGRSTPSQGGVRTNVTQVRPQTVKTAAPVQAPQQPAPLVYTNITTGVPPIVISQPIRQPNQNAQQTTRTDLPTPGTIIPPTPIEAQPKEDIGSRQFGLGFTETAVKTTDILLTDLDRANLPTSPNQKEAIKGGVGGLFLAVDIPLELGKDLARAVTGRKERGLGTFFESQAASVSEAGGLALAGNFGKAETLASSLLGGAATGGLLAESSGKVPSEFMVKRFVGLEVKTSELTRPSALEINSQSFKATEGLRSNLQRVVETTGIGTKRVIVQEVIPKFEVLTSKKPVLMEAIEGPDFESTFKLTTVTNERGLAQARQVVSGRGTVEVKPQITKAFQQVSEKGISIKAELSPSDTIGTPQIIPVLKEVPRSFTANVGSATFRFKSSEGQSTVFGLEQTPTPGEFTRGRVSRGFTYSNEGEQVFGKTQVELGGLVRTKSTSTEVASQSLDIRFKFKPDELDLIQFQKQTLGERITGGSKSGPIFKEDSLEVFSQSNKNSRIKIVQRTAGEKIKVTSGFEAITKGPIEYPISRYDKPIPVVGGSVPKSLGFPNVKSFEIISPTREARTFNPFTRIEPSVDRITANYQSPFKETFTQPTQVIPSLKETPSQKEIPSLKELPLPKAIQSPRELIGPKELPSIREVPAFKEIPSLKEIPALKQTPALKQIPALKQLPSLKETPLESSSQPKFFKLKTDEDLFPRSKKKGQPAFEVFVRKRGEFFELEPQSLLTKNQAFAAGVKAVANTASATFKIRPTGKTTLQENRGNPFLNLASDYLLKPKTIKPVQAGEELFTERSKYRIKSPGELQEITFKGIAARRTNKILGVF